MIMKTLILVAAFVATIAAPSAFAQDKQKQALLSSYYEIKNALVNSDAATASAKAGELLKEIRTADTKAFSAEEATEFKASQEKLSTDASHIAESKDLGKQREYFAALSAGFFKLAKTVKLSSAPVYYQFCPMKKSYWLSETKEIKNPYYGKQMLTCGKISETI